MENYIVTVKEAGEDDLVFSCEANSEKEAIENLRKEIIDTIEPDWEDEWDGVGYPTMKQFLKEFRGNWECVRTLHVTKL